MMIICSVLLLLLPCALSQVINPPEANPSYWHSLALEELEKAISQSPNERIAKNIILIIGDGMGISTTTAARIHKGQLEGQPGEETKLVFEDFPHVGLIKTYDLDHQVSDSSSTATAILCGSKANSDTVGVSGKVAHKDEKACGDYTTYVDSIAQYFIDRGMDAGFVTTARVTHATPAALYAHSPSRKYECDGVASSESCMDIARQLVYEKPGQSLKVIMGGGMQTMVGELESTPEDPLDSYTCQRTDDKNLVKEWEAGHANARVVQNKEQLHNIDVDKTDYLMGIFYKDHMPFKYEMKENMPTLAEMSKKAIEILQKDNNGFMLLVEGAKIDLAHHQTQAGAALLEVVELDIAVSTILDMVDVEETLIIVTADHSHPVVINGYPDRGANILGFVQDAEATDNLPYTTLMYTNGEAFYKHLEVNDKDEVQRVDTTAWDVQSYEYQQASGVPVITECETHGGEDVAVYAIGPMAHLFHGLHEQTYIHQVMAYAACVGPYHNTEECQSGRVIYNGANNLSTTYIYIFSVIVQCLFTKLLFKN